MAPEIIELNGATTKSDIWSVGCTVIELITGSPPYYELSPMSALFRIVQDEYPPLPDGDICTNSRDQSSIKGLVGSMFSERSSAPGRFI